MKTEVEGLGLHSGKPARATIRSAPPGSGIVFIHKGKKIPATIDHLKETNRGTTLEGVAVVEHFLSAAYGIGAYDLEVEVDGDELPALDGSALPWVDALEKVGHWTLDVGHFELVQPIKITDGLSSIEAVPYNGFKVDFMVNFEGIGPQEFTFDAERQNYKKEIAPARTFGYLEEYESLKARGLALGASYENALVLNKKGHVNDPRFPDEVVRHKISDLIGDLALLGRPLKARIKAVRSGHKLNAELVRRILG
jgi:UDP-3-O-[3-hydroxymyristoyl] N-acetylglucosamine deacetylase